MVGEEQAGQVVALQAVAASFHTVYGDSTRDATRCTTCTCTCTCICTFTCTCICTRCKLCGTDSRPVIHKTVR